jgi:hypothetical protein
MKWAMHISGKWQEKSSYRVLGAKLEDKMAARNICV